MIDLHYRTKARIKRALRVLLAFKVFWLPFVVLRRFGTLVWALHSGVRMNWAGKGTLFNFRRSIHRIEKGLSFKNRRPVFAEDYIIETVWHLRELVAQGCDPDTEAWGRAVLAEYFRVVDPTPDVIEARRDFEEMSGAAFNESVPYPAADRPPVSVAFSELASLARRRRSVRFFTDRPVDAKLVRKALEVALEAPSSCNRQAFRVVYYDRPEEVDLISAVPGGIAGYRVPTIVVLVGRYRGYFDERDVKAPIVDASLAAMSFILALETMGLSSVCINWPNHPSRERRIRRLMTLDKDEFVVMMIGVGHADPEGLVPFSAKFDPDHVLTVNPPVPDSS